MVGKTVPHRAGSLLVMLTSLRNAKNSASASSALQGIATACASSGDDSKLLADGIPPGTLREVASALKLFAYDAGVVAAGCRAIEALLCQGESAQEVLQLGVAEVMETALRTQMRDRAVTQSILLAASRLAAVPAFRHSVGSRGLVPDVCDALWLFRDDGECLGAGCLLLSRVAQDSAAVAQSVVNKGGLDLAAAAVHFTADGTTVGRGLALVTRLLQQLPSTSAEVKRQNLPRLVVQGMYRHPNHELLARSGCLAIATMVDCGSDMAGELVEAGAETVVSALLHSSPPPAVLAGGLRALIALLHRGMVQQQEVLTPVVVDAMLNFPQNVEIQVLGPEALGRLGSRSIIARRGVLAVGGFEAVVTGLGAHLGVVAVVENACAAIAVLLSDNDVEGGEPPDVEVVSERGVGAEERIDMAVAQLLAAFRRHFDSGVVAAVCRVLMVVVKSFAGTSAIVQHPQALSLLVGALEVVEAQPFAIRTLLGMYPVEEQALESVGALDKIEAVSSRYRFSLDVTFGKVLSPPIDPTEAPDEQPPWRSRQVFAGKMSCVAWRLSPAVATPQRDTSMVMLLASLASLTEECPRIVKFMGITRSRGVTMALMEFCPNGCLASSKVLPPTAKNLAWARQVAEALRFLHTRDPPAAHGYLTPSHCLLDEDDNVKLSFPLPWRPSLAVVDDRTGNAMELAPSKVQHSGSQSSIGSGASRASPAPKSSGVVSNLADLQNLFSGGLSSTATSRAGSADTSRASSPRGSQSSIPRFSRKAKKAKIPSWVVEKAGLDDPFRAPEIRGWGHAYGGQFVHWRPVDIWAAGAIVVFLYGGKAATKTMKLNGVDGGIGFMPTLMPSTLEPVVRQATKVAQGERCTAEELARALSGCHHAGWLRR